MSDPNTRSVYDRVGKAGMDKTAEGAEMDPTEIFGKIFGGEAFEDYVGFTVLWQGADRSDWRDCFGQGYALLFRNC